MSPGGLWCWNRGVGFWIGIGIGLGVGFLIFGNSGGGLFLDIGIFSGMD